MKISNIINGFVYYDGSYFPFQFTKESFELTIFPDYESWLKYTDPIFVFDEIFLPHDPKKSKEREYLNLIGESSDRRNVLFHLAKKPRYNNGIITFHVIWLYFTNASVTENDITTIKVTGQSINDYFPPEQVFKRTIVSDSEDTKKITKMTVDAMSSEVEDGGSLKFDSIPIKIELQAYATMHSATTVPLSCESALYLTFEKAVDCIFAEEICLGVLRTFQILGNRNNISFNDFDLVSFNSDRNTSCSGVLSLYLKDYLEETNEEKQFLIKHQYIKGYLGSLIKHVLTKRIGISSLCENRKDSFSYRSDRIYMILADYERFFNNEYKSLIRDSDSFLDTKKSVLIYLDKQMKNDNKNRIDYERIRNSVNNIGKGISYEKKVRFGLVEMKDLMEPFVNYYYEGEYSKVITNLSKRIGTIRNKISHGSLNIDIKQENLKDIRIIEHMTYALLLRSIGIPDYEIIRGLNTLFDNNSISTYEKV